MKKTSAILVASLLYAPAALAQVTDPAPATPAEAAQPAPVVGDVASDVPAGAAPEATTPADPAAPEAAVSLEATAAPGPTEEVPLSQAELEALGFGTSEGGETTSLDTDLHVSGFLDFNVTRLIAAKSSVNRGFLPPHTNFYVGNFNVYLTKNLTESIRTMGEVRFSYLPNGNIPTPGNTGQNTPTTSTNDYADFERPMKWGGIEIERVYLEWSAHRYLTIRGGQFLTPYGIWNVDHGSPTFIPVQRPYVVGNGLFPERQTGFELYGRWDATNNGTLGYHATLSNGSGPISEYRDLDDNKAVGGRLFWEQHNIGDFKVGGSAYYGRDTDATDTVRPNAMGVLKPAYLVHRQYDILALALDVQWKWKGLHLQGEYITQQRRYTDRGRQAVTNTVTQQVVFPTDAQNWGAYGLAGYRLPWFGIMPYVIYSYIDLVDAAGTGTKLNSFNGGLNIRPVDMVVLKLEYSHAVLAEKLLGSDDPFKLFQAQVAWAF